MRLETKPEQRQEIRESFNRHLKYIADGSITDAQMELSSHPLMFHHHHPIMNCERATFTYEGYTQSGERFTLTIGEKFNNLTTKGKQNDP